MYIRKYLLLLLIFCNLLFLSGCEQELDLNRYKDPAFEKTLVVNSILNPDSLISVSVTHPYFFSDTHTSFTPVTSLDVQVAESDGIYRSLSYNPKSKLYISDKKPLEGEVINLRIKGNTEEVISCDTIPDKVEIKSVEAYAEGPTHIYWGSDYRFTYKITFQDTPDMENYYFLSIDDASLKTEFSQMGQIDYTTDYVFQVLASMINNNISGWQPSGGFGYPFCDKDIDGKLYTITLSEILQNPFTSMIERLPRKVKLFSISRAYFQYMVSVLSMDYEDSALIGNMLSLGLMEPEKIYTNIIGGAGLMGSYNLSIVQIDLLELTNCWPNK